MADYYRPGSGGARRGWGHDDNAGDGRHAAGYGDTYVDDGDGEDGDYYGDDTYGDPGWDGYADGDRGYAGYPGWDDGGAHRRAAGLGSVKAAAGDVVWRYRNAPLWVRVTADICIALLAVGLIVGVSLVLHSESTPERAGAAGGTTTTGAPTTTSFATTTTLAPTTKLAPTTETTAPTTTASTVPPASAETTTPTSRPPATRPPTTSPTTVGPRVHYRNCFEAFRAGALPLHRGDPGYSPDLDDDHDGNACEIGEGI